VFGKVPKSSLKKNRSCFSHQIGRCTGLCVGQISETAFETQIEQHFSDDRDTSAEIIIGPGPNASELSFVWSEDAQLLGWGFFPASTALLPSKLMPYLVKFPERPETQRLIRRFLKHNSHFKVRRDDPS
jgi:hypothetical protein